MRIELIGGGGLRPQLHPATEAETPLDEELKPCFCSLTTIDSARGVLPPRSALGDEEGAHLPSALPPVVDAHVHLFPDGLFDALWRWFDRWGWPVRYKLYTPQVLDFLFSRGVERVVALHYAHKPGMAELLNSVMAELCGQEPRLLGVATVFPGERGAAEILRRAFAQGLAGVKLHCHVQGFAPDEPRLRVIYEACAEAGKPLIMHAGREPKSPGYAVDPHEICSAERVGRVLREHPRLKLCVPHLGADEYGPYEALLEQHDTLWLDTTMMMAGYFPGALPLRMLQVRPDRVLYGTDFPNIPYAWDREVKALAAAGLGEQQLAAILSGNAAQLFGL